MRRAFSLQPVFDTVRQRNLSFYEIKPLVTYIRATSEFGNMTIGKDDLGNMSNLRILDLDTMNSYPPKHYLTIQATEFRHKPQLKGLHIGGFILVNSTIDALLSLKDQIESLSVRYSSLAERLINEVAKFTNLTHLSGICHTKIFPQTTFRNSAAKLKRIDMRKRGLPNMTSQLFRGMHNLSSLIWFHSNITTVEAGAFDELVNLQYLELSHNKLTSFPPGLFNKTRKLERVELLNNEINNLSREKFTHVENYGDFRLKLVI